MSAMQKNTQQENHIWLHNILLLQQAMINSLIC